MKQSMFSFPVLQADFFGYQRNAYQIIFPNANAWSISAAQMAIFTERRDSFEVKYLVTDNDGWQNPIATQARNIAADLLKEILSEIYEKNIVYNDAVDADTKAALHIHFVEGNTGAITPAPRTKPIVTLASKETSMVHLVYVDSATPTSHAKPANVVFCEFHYKLDGAAPEIPKDCPERLFVSKSNTTIVFEPEQRGKKIYGFARWVNKNSKVGPWSDLVTAFIP